MQLHAFLMKDGVQTNSGWDLCIGGCWFFGFVGFAAFFLYLGWNSQK